MNKSLDDVLREWACSVVCPNTMEPTNEYEMRAVKSYMVHGFRLLHMSQSIKLEELTKLEDLLKRIYKWDVMDTAVDGRYWRQEIAKSLRESLEL